MKKMQKISCMYCHHQMDIVTGTRFVLDRYLVENVTYHRCPNCGQEAIPLEEYEKIRLEIAARGKKEKSKENMKKPMPAGWKYPVLTLR